MDWQIIEETAEGKENIVGFNIYPTIFDGECDDECVLNGLHTALLKEEYGIAFIPRGVEMRAKVVFVFHHGIIEESVWLPVQRDKTTETMRMVKDVVCGRRAIRQTELLRDPGGNIFLKVFIEEIDLSISLAALFF